MLHLEKHIQRQISPYYSLLAINICNALSLHWPSEVLAPEVIKMSSAKLFPSSKAVLTHCKVPKGPLKKKKKKTDPLLEVSSFLLLVKYEYLNQADKSRSKRSILNAMCASPAQSRKDPRQTPTWK